MLATAVTVAATLHGTARHSIHTLSLSTADAHGRRMGLLLQQLVRGCSSFVAWHCTHNSPASWQPCACCLLPCACAVCVVPFCRLRSRAQSVHDRVYRDTYGCGRRGNAHCTGLMLDGVQDVIDTLTGYR